MLGQTRWPASMSIVSNALRQPERHVRIKIHAFILFQKMQTYCQSFIFFLLICLVFTVHVDCGCNKLRMHKCAKWTERGREKKKENV